MRRTSLITLCLVLAGSILSACASFGDAREAGEATRPPTVTATAAPSSTSAPSPTPSPTDTPAQSSDTPATPTPPPTGEPPTMEPPTMEPTPQPTPLCIVCDAEHILGLVPVKPGNVNLFMTDYLEQPVYPEAYPEGTPMQPAEGVEKPLEVVRAELEAFLVTGLSADDPRVGETLALFDDPRVIERVPDARLRAAFTLLQTTIAAPLIGEFLDSGIYAGTLDWGETGWAFTETSETGEDGKRYTSMSQRYQHEHFALVAPNVVHALLHHDERFSYPEDLIVLTMATTTYLQLVARHPEIAYHGTELSRFNNTFAMALLNSHRSGSPDIRLRVPGGTSVLPGSPEDAADFWSLVVKEVGSSPMSPAGQAILANLLRPGTPLPPGLQFSPEAVELIDGNISRQVLEPVARLRTSVLLTMITTEEIAVLLDMTPQAVIDMFGLQEVEALLAASR